MDLFGALVFQVIGQQISVIAATAIFARLTDRFGGRVPAEGELAAVDPGALPGVGLSRRKAVLHCQGEGRGFESRRPLAKSAGGSDYVSDVRHTSLDCLVWESLGISTAVNWSGRWKLASANLRQTPIGNDS